MTEDKQPKTDQVKQGKDPISAAPTQQEIKPIEMDPSVSNQTPKEREQKTSAEPTEAKTEKKPYDPEEFQGAKKYLYEVLFSEKSKKKPSKPDRAKMKKFPSIEVGVDLPVNTEQVDSFFNDCVTRALEDQTLERVLNLYAGLHSYMDHECPNQSLFNKQWINLIKRIFEQHNAFKNYRNPVYTNLEYVALIRRALIEADSKFTVSNDKDELDLKMRTIQCVAIHHLLCGSADNTISIRDLQSAFEEYWFQPHHGIEDTLPHEKLEEMFKSNPTKTKILFSLKTHLDVIEAVKSEVVRNQIEISRLNETIDQQTQAIQEDKTEKQALSTEINQLKSTLSELQDQRKGDSFVSGHALETLRGRLRKVLSSEIDLLENGLTALRRGKSHVMDEHADRAIENLRKALTDLSADDG